MKNAYKTQNIFISSTFLDMQVERDVLKKRVLPVIKEYALKYRINVELVDLRFGIDIGNENEISKIVNICESEIERCRPLFIGLLGNRYGTMFKDDLSITALEMKYSMDKKYNTLFYQRNISNGETLDDSVKEIYYQNEEKAKVFSEKLNTNIKKYCAFYDKNKNELVLEDNFTRMLISDIKNILDKEYSNVLINNYLSPYINHSSYLSSSYISIFSSIENELLNIEEIKEKIILLFAPSGCGKSMILSKLVSYCIEKEKIIISYSPQINSNKCHLLELINSYNSELSDVIKQDYIKQENLSDALDIFYRLLSCVGKEIIFICDSYESIVSNDEINKITWIKEENIPNNVKFVLSTNSEKDVNTLKYVSKIITPDLLNKEGIEKYLDGYLQRKSQKVSKYFFDSIVQKLDDLGDVSLMYVSTSIEYLFYNDRRDAETIADISKTSVLDDSVLTFYLDKLKMIPKSLEDLINILVEKKLELANKELVEIVLTCLAHNESGLKEEDIESICNELKIPYFNSDFAFIRYVLKDMINQSYDGTYVLVHDYYKRAFKKKYINLNIINALCNQLLTLENDKEYKHTSLCKLLYLTNRKKEVLKLIKSSLYEEYMNRYTSNIIEILERKISFIDDIKKVLIEKDFAMYTINYLIPGLNISNHSTLIDKLKDCEETSYYHIGIVSSEIKKENVNSDLLVESSRKINCYIDTCSTNDRLLLVELYIKASELLIEKNEPFGACRYLSLANALLKEDDKEDRTGLGWGKLANVYLMYSKIFFNTNMFNFIREYYYEALDIVSNHNIPMTEIERFIKSSLELLSGIQHYNLDLKVEVDKDLLELSIKYKNEAKTFSSIYLYLLVKMKYYEVNGLLYSKTIDFLGEIKDFYLKTNNLRIKQLQLMLNFKATLSSKQPKEKKMQMLESFINNMLVNTSKCKFDIYEIEELLFCYIALKNASINENIALSNKYITPYVNVLVEKNDREEILFRYIKREILYQNSFDSENKKELLSKVVPLSIKVYLSNPTLINVNSLMSDIFYYCDSLKNESLEEQQKTLKKGLDCLNHFNTMFNEENNFTFYKTYFYIAKNALLLSKLDLANSYLYKMTELINALIHDQNSNLILPLLNELYYFNSLMFDESNERKEFANRIYDLLLSLNKDYLDSLNYIKYEDVQPKLKTNVDIESSPVDIDLFYNDKLSIVPILDFDNAIDHPTFDFPESFEDKLGVYYFQEYSFKQSLFEYEIGETEEEKISNAYKMIEQEDYRGYQLLGLVYESKDLNLAMKYYYEGAKLNNSYCYLALGIIYYYNKRFDDAFNYLYQGAILGNYQCINYVVNYFRKRLDDIDGSYELLMDACEKNMMEDYTHSICQETLKIASKILDYGDLDPEDYLWYVRFYRMTNTRRSYDGVRTTMVGYNHINKDEYFFIHARYGALVGKNPQMMSFLSYAYLVGIGTEVDYVKAYNWCIDAIENGDFTMGMNIVDCIYSGYGTYEIDYEEADQILFLMYQVEPSAKHAAAILSYIGEDALKPKYVKELKNKIKEHMQEN